MTRAQDDGAKRAALERLTMYQRWVTARDPLVLDAKHTGATYAEIMAASGIGGKATVSTILRDECTPPAPDDDTVTPLLSLPTDYPHHDCYRSVELATGVTPDYRPGTYAVRYLTDAGVQPPPRVIFRFFPFLGEEAEPQAPAISDSQLYVSPEQQRLRRALCLAEYDVAHELWDLARYTSMLAPLLQEAAQLWPPYSRTLATLTAEATTAHAGSDSVALNSSQMATAIRWSWISRVVDSIIMARRSPELPDHIEVARRLGISDTASDWRFDTNALATLQGKLADARHRHLQHDSTDPDATPHESDTPR